MEVDVKVKSIIKVDLDPIDAYWILVKTSYMDCILNEDIDAFTTEDDFGELCVYDRKTGNCIDDRGELFNVLVELGKQIIPNFHLR